MDRLAVRRARCKRPYLVRRGKTRLVLMIVAAVLVAATIVALRNLPKPVRPVGPGTTSLTESEIDALNRLQMRAVAHLENSELRQATEGFEQILAKLPKDSMPFRAFRSFLLPIKPAPWRLSAQRALPPPMNSTVGADT